MVNIDVLIREGKISRISELELSRYISFFENSYKDNLEHSKFAKEKFPRWSIISGYYAMHDITKLLLSKKFRLKVDLEVHSTTIKALRELIHNNSLLDLIDRGYKEFLFLANDLADAKKERVKTQYFTGTDYMMEEYKKRASEFIESVVEPCIEKIGRLL